MEAAFLLNHSIDEFAQGPCVKPAFIRRLVDNWTPPTIGWWKINCDATLVNGKASLAFVVRDKLGLLVPTSSILTSTPTAYDAEVCAIE